MAFRFSHTAPGNDLLRKISNIFLYSAVYYLLVYIHPVASLSHSWMRVALSRTHMYPLTRHAFRMCYDSIPPHKPRFHAFNLTPCKCKNTPWRIDNVILNCYLFDRFLLQLIMLRPIIVFDRHALNCIIRTNFITWHPPAPTVRRIPIKRPHPKSIVQTVCTINGPDISNQ